MQNLSNFPMTNSGRRARLTIQDLPPKMASKALNFGENQQHDQNYYNGIGSKQVKSESNSSISTTQSYANQDPKYQYTNSQNQSSNKDKANSSSKRGQKQAKYVIKDQPKDQITTGDSFFGSRNPPMCFNIITRGNIPGLIFQHYLVNK